MTGKIKKGKNETKQNGFYFTIKDRIALHNKAR